MSKPKPQPNHDDEEIVEFPITGELDLHTFRPSEIGELIPEYLRECQLCGILTVRVVHGKGTGALRKGVHAILDRLEIVARYGPCGETDGSWGATRVWLKRGASAEQDA